ncbi:MAG: class I SAM-dependent methyltransferase [Bacteriovoracaceae bacterium]
MKTYKLTREFPTISVSHIGGYHLDAFCRKVFFEKLALLKVGKIDITEVFNESYNHETKTFSFGQKNAAPELTTHLTILKPSAYSRIALGGSIGSGESFRDKDWDVSSNEELTNLVRIFVQNRETLMALEKGIGSLVAPVQKVLHKFRNNTIAGAKKNIHAHYDIGNDFFGLFLDSSWMYSSAIFKDKNSTLLEGSIEKNDRICRKLKLSAKDHLLEIGTGWGGFAVHAARNYGCKVTTTTISEEQYAFACKRVQEENLGHLIEVLFKDYRLLDGKYDCLVSIEMIEAVGLNHLETYFEKCSSLLKENGVMLLQAISIQDQYYEYARKNVDFIQTHIFPGAGIPSVGSIASAVAKKTDMRVSHLEDFGTHYARTLRFWSDNLKNNYAEMIKLGYPEELYRLWQFYFSYCEGGFLERSIGCMQVQLLKGRAEANSLFDIE